MFVCTDCWNASSIQLGKCTACGEFWTYKRVQWVWVTSSSKKKKTVGSPLEKKTVTNLAQRNFSIPEFVRLFPWWVKQSASYLLAWEPGIWKSTVMLQVIDDLIKNNSLQIAYVTAEETVSQVKKRFERIIWPLAGSITLFQSNDCEDICSSIEEYGFDMIIIDSIQTISTGTSDSATGSPTQVKQCCDLLWRAAKNAETTLLLIGHITKWGEIAWPKYLEHIVDVVMYLEWEQYWNYRFLRFKKNRFWHTDEVGIFEMTQSWLEPVYDLKERMLSNQWESTPWTVLTVGIDSWRAVLIQLEVLVNKMSWKYPQRVAIGIENSRLNIVIAILERYLWLKLNFLDIYVNIPWEFSFRDSWLDLALATAIWSQVKNISIDWSLVFIGELWLSGKALKTKYHTKRVNEAKWLTIIDNQRISTISKLPSIL